MNDKLLEAANLLLEAVERDGDPSYAHLCMLYRSARTKAQAEQSASATSVQEHVGWSDEFGNLFPLAAYKPKSATWRDGHKTTWRPVYSPAPTPAQESRPQGHNPEGETMKPGTFVLVRTYSAGVHFGTLAKQDGKLVTLTTARRIWSWKGANTLNEIANNGVGKGSRISNPVPEIELTEAIELIPVSDEARAILENVGWTK